MSIEQMAANEVIVELKEENKTLKMSLEEKDENCYSLAKENEKLKEWIKEHCNNCPLV